MQGIITAVGSTVEIDGKAYTVSPKLLGLFNTDNQTVLTAAEIAVKITNNEITEVTQLTLNEMGTLDAKDSTIAKLIVNVDEVSVENLTVLGDVTLTQNVTGSFNVTNVKMNNLITAETSNLVASTRNIAAVSTRLKITFTDSTVAYVEIRQDKVHFAISGSSVVESVIISANDTVLQSPVAVLPNLKIEKGVTKVELNASIASVVVDTENPVEIGGKGNFDSVVINTQQDVKIVTEGTIGSLQSTAQNIELGGNVKVGATVIDGEIVDPAEIIKNIEEVKDNINTEIKEEDKVPYFVAKAMGVQGKFGLITLSLTNADNATIKYAYQQEGEAPLSSGQVVPAEAKLYEVNEEINWWFLQEIHVYKVDSNNQVIESFRITRNQISQPISQSKLEGDTLTIKTTFNNQLELAYLYIADDTSFWMTEEKTVLSKDENGVPTLTIKVGNGIHYEGNKTYDIHYNVDSIDPKSGYLAMDSLGNDENRDAVYLNLLKQFKTSNFKPNEDKKVGFTAWDYNHRIERISRNLMKDYTANTVSYYQFELDAILNHLTDFASVDSAKSQIKTAKENIAPLLKQYNEATEALNDLYRDDRYSYPYKEWLREGVMQQDINAVEALVDSLPETVDKATVVRDLDQIKNIFTLKQVARETARLTLSAQEAVDYEEIFDVPAATLANDRVIKMNVTLSSGNQQVISYWNYDN